MISNKSFVQSRLDRDNDLVTRWCNCLIYRNVLDRLFFLILQNVFQSNSA